MRHIKIIIFVCGLLGFASITCEKNSNETVLCTDSYVSVESLNDVTGIIGFDNTTNQYFINKFVDATIDEIYTLHPCVLADEYKKVNLRVYFSGELYVSDDLPKPALGGQKVFHINLSKIGFLPLS
jgi:hypothetical protein